MNQIYEKYCKPFDRKIMAVGTSLGASKLCHLVGEDGDKCVLSAAVCCQAPMKMWTALEYAEKTFYGFYDKVLGGFLALLY